MKQRIGMAAAAVGLILGLLAAGPAAAATKDGALTTLQAFLAAGDEDQIVMPFADSQWDGVHVCGDESVLLVVGWFDGNAAGAAPRTVRQILASMDAVTITMVLDGAPLATTRTEPTRVVDAPDGWTDVFVFYEGAVFSPGTLAVGSHTLAFDLTDPASGTVEGSSITFVVDPPGTGACVG